MCVKAGLCEPFLFQFHENLFGNDLTGNKVHLRDNDCLMVQLVCNISLHYNKRDATYTAGFSLKRARPSKF